MFFRVYALPSSKLYKSRQSRYKLRLRSKCNDSGIANTEIIIEMQSTPKLIISGTNTLVLDATKPVIVGDAAIPTPIAPMT